MSCKACDKAQEDGDTYYVRVGRANVAVSGCREHANELIERLRSNPFETDEWRDYAKHAQDELLPKVRESAVSVALVPESGPDIKFLLELGTMIWYGKPILVLASEGRQVPDGLRRVATAVVQGDIGREEGRALLQEKLMQFLDDMPDE